MKRIVIVSGKMARKIAVAIGDMAEVRVITKDDKTPKLPWIEEIVASIKAADLVIYSFIWEVDQYAIHKAIKETGKRFITLNDDAIFRDDPNRYWWSGEGLLSMYTTETKNTISKLREIVTTMLRINESR